MILILETIMIIIYMINGYAGFVAMCGMVLYTLYKTKHENKANRLMTLIIISLPLSYVGFFGFTTVEHMLSWYNLFLLLFLFHLFKLMGMRIKLSKFSGTCIVVLLLALMVNIGWSTDVIKTITEIIQVFLMVLPIAIIHSNIKLFDEFHTENSEKLIFCFADICTATAIASLVQFYLYKMRGIVIGNIRWGGMGRAIYYCMFRGASILPIFMGIGFLCILINQLNGKIKALDICKAAIIFLAMTYNNSRTGLAMMIATIALIILNQTIKHFNFRTVLFSIIIAGAALWGISYILSVRTGLDSFLDDNNRMYNINNGLKIWQASFKNILFGEGFAGERWKGITKPHNVVIQTLAQCGAVSLTLVLFLIVKYILDNRRNKYILVFMFIILTGMLVTDFYANAFTTVFFILIDIDMQRFRVSQSIDTVIDRGSKEALWRLKRDGKN